MDHACHRGSGRLAGSPDAPAPKQQTKGLAGLLSELLVASSSRRPARCTPTEASEPSFGRWCASSSAARRCFADLAFESPWTAQTLAPVMGLATGALVVRAGQEGPLPRTVPATAYVAGRGASSRSSSRSLWIVTCGSSAAASSTSVTGSRSILPERGYSHAMASAAASSLSST